LVNIEDLVDEVNKPIEQGLPWFLESLTEMTYGRRECEVYAFGAGTGIGKTDFITQQIAFDVCELDQKVGVFFLEQQPTESAKRIAGKVFHKRFHVPDGSWEPEELVQGIEQLSGKVMFYNSFGQTDWEVIKNKIRYMAHAESIRLFYVDHLTAMADTADEKSSIEQIMKEMAGLANELKIIIHFVSHLATPDGKPHEEGGHVSIRHFKGSRSIGFWSYFMFGLERNQQDDDPIKRQTTRLRVLKDRYTGQATGNCIYLGYNHETTQLYQTANPEEAEETANPEDYL
jgi:twinkle protein